MVSQLALEMYSGHQGFGGLNLYSRSRGVFNDEETVQLAHLFAAQAAVVMDRVATVQQFNQAVTSRTVIGQATGLIMERYGLTAQQAFQFLVRTSSTANLKLRVVAEEIVTAANEKAAPTG